MLSPNEMETFLTRVEKDATEFFSEKVKNMLNEVLHPDNIGEVVKLFLKAGDARAICDPLKPSPLASEAYRNEVVQYLVAAMKDEILTVSMAAIEALGKLGEVDPLIQALTSDDDRRRFVVKELRENSRKALVPLLKAHKCAAQEGKDLTFLDEAIHSLLLLGVLPKPLIEAVENEQVTLSHAFNMLGRMGEMGNKDALEYLTHVYLSDKNKVKKDLAGKQLDRLGKRPKSWRERVFR